MTSLRRRLIVGILAGITVILAFNGLVIYVIVRAQLRSEMDQALGAVARSTANRMALELGRPEVGGDRLLLSGVEFVPRGSSGDAPARAAQETWDRLRAISRHAAAIRIDGMLGDGRRACDMVHILGRRSIGLARLTEDRDASRAEVEALVLAAQEGAVDVAVLGEGALASGAWTLAELLQLAREVRGRVPESVQVTVCEPREVWLTQPALADSVDVIHALVSPFRAGVAIEDAVRVVACWLEELVQAARGQPVVAVGVGWPWAGPTVGAAAPSAENATRFLSGFAAWARLNGVEYVYRAAADRAPRGAAADAPAEAWGLLAADASFKPELRALLDAGIDATGPPRIEVLGVPQRGLAGDLTGSVRNVGTLDHRVVVYIRSQGAWWNKPSFANPVTRIHCDGTWSTDVTTGEGDEDADALAAFLVPAGYTPPFLEGARALPDELFAKALDVAEIAR